MQIFVVGMNHKTMPLELRERFAFSQGSTDQALETLASHSKLYESVLLSTCNRTEIYGVSEISEDYPSWISDFLCAEREMPKEALESGLYALSGPDAAEHLMKVACGLDSMIVGEAEILGQVRRAYERAGLSKNAGKILHRLFQRTLSVGKAVRAQFGKGMSEVSVSSVAVELAKRIFEELTPRTVMIVGAGQTGEQMLGHLVRAGVQSIIASNRSLDKAGEIAQRYGGRAVDLQEAVERMQDADIVLSSTGSPHMLFTRDQIAGVMLKRKGRPLFFIDVAVPRDIDPRAQDLENVFVYNIDDLQQVQVKRQHERETYLAQSREKIAMEVEHFFGWFASLAVTPTISRLTHRWEDIRRAETEKSLARLRDLPGRQREEVEYLTKRIVGQLLHAPKEHLKRFANRKDGYYYTETLSDLFELKPEKQEQKQD